MIHCFFLKLSKIKTRNSYFNASAYNVRPCSIYIQTHYKNLFLETKFNLLQGFLTILTTLLREEKGNMITEKGDLTRLKNTVLKQRKDVVFSSTLEYNSIVTPADIGNILNNLTAKVYYDPKVQQFCNVIKIYVKSFKQKEFWYIYPKYSELV